MKLVPRRLEENRNLYFVSELKVVQEPLQVVSGLIERSISI